MRNKKLTVALFFACVLLLSGCGSKGEVISKADTYSDEYKELTVTEKDTVLENVTADKIIIAKEVGDGDVTLKNVEVAELEVYGGGEHSVHFINSKAEKVTTHKEDGIVRFVLEEGSTVTTLHSTNTRLEVKAGAEVTEVSANANADVVVEEGAKAQAITVAAETAKASVAGEVATVTVAAPKAEVVVAETAKVAEVKLEEAAAEAKVAINGAVEKLAVTAPAAEVVVEQTAKVAEVKVEEKAESAKVTVTGEVSTMTVAAAKTEVKIEETAKVEAVKVEKKAENTALTVNGTVAKVETQAVTTVEGTGKVEKIEATKKDLVTVAENTTAVKKEEIVENKNLGTTTNATQETAQAPTQSTTTQKPAETKPTTPEESKPVTPAPTQPTAPEKEEEKKEDEKEEESKPSHSHVYTSKITTTATCTKEGVETFTCSCGDSYTKTVAKAAHKEETIAAIQATCGSTGLTEGKKCSVCGVITVEQTIVSAQGAHSHTLVTKGECDICGTKEDTIKDLTGTLNIGELNIELTTAEPDINIGDEYLANSGVTEIVFDGGTITTPYKDGSRNPNFGNSHVYNEFNGSRILLTAPNNTKFVFKNLTINGYYNFISTNRANSYTLEFINCTFNGCWIGETNSLKNITFTGCTFTLNGIDTTNVKDTNPLWLQTMSGQTVTLNGCNIEANRPIKYAEGESGATLNVTNCTFKLTMTPYDDSSNGKPSRLTAIRFDGNVTIGEITGNEMISGYAFYQTDNAPYSDENYDDAGNNNTIPAGARWREAY